MVSAVTGSAAEMVGRRAVTVQRMDLLFYQQELRLCRYSTVKKTILATRCATIFKQHNILKAPSAVATLRRNYTRNTACNNSQTNTVFKRHQLLLLLSHYRYCYQYPISLSLSCIIMSMTMIIQYPLLVCIIHDPL